MFIACDNPNLVASILALGSCQSQRYMICVTCFFFTLRESKNTRTCHNCMWESHVHAKHVWFLHIYVSMCFFTCLTCKNVPQNLIPQATACLALTYLHLWMLALYSWQCLYKLKQIALLSKGTLPEYYMTSQKSGLLWATQFTGSTHNVQDLSLHAGISRQVRLSREVGPALCIFGWILLHYS